MSWLDLFLVLFFLFQILSGFLQGFFWGLIGIFCFASAVWFALQLTPPLMDFLVPLGLPDEGGVLLFVLLALLTNAILALLFLQLRWEPGRGKFVQTFGGLVGAVWGSLGFLLIPWLYACLVGPLPAEARLSRLGLSLVREPMERLSERMPKKDLPQLAILPAGCNRTFLVDPRPSGKAKLQAVEPNPEEREMLALVNRTRRAHDLAPLEWDGQLAWVARSHCRDMVKKNYYAHRDPVGWDIGDRLHHAGLPFTLAGENLVFAPNVALALEGILESPPHRDNLLRPEFRRFGTGILELPLRTRFDPRQGVRPAKGYGGYLLMTQVFAK